MFDRPQDFVIMFAIMAAVVFTASLGIESIELQGANINNNTFFSDVEGKVMSTTGLKGTADEASKVIDPSDNPENSEASEEGIITQGLQSLRSIGSTFGSIKSTLTEGGAVIGINPLYISLVIFVLVIIFFILIYSWARGR